MKQAQSYNDGILNIYTVGNIAEAGNMPAEGLTIKVGPLHYEERMVGTSRYFTAMQNNIKIDRLLRVPRILAVSTADMAILDKQYSIKQIQYPPDAPLSMDLSLERIEQEYDVN